MLKLHELSLATSMNCALRYLKARHSHSIVNGSEILNVTGSFDAALDDET
jgi:hypothetical protein